VNHTVENHLQARRIEPRAAADKEVLGFWAKAITAYGDTLNASASVESRLLRAYDAARIAAFAMVRDAGYRTRGGESHHYVTFDIARSLAADPDLRQSLARMDGLRKVRHAVEYEASDDVDEAAVEEARQLAEQVITLGAVHLRNKRPGLVIPDTNPTP
jgi:hypothetical protein